MTATRRIVVVALAALCGLAPFAAADGGSTAADHPDIPALYKAPPVVELVTMGVGALIWERHGHIAICVTEHGVAEAEHDRYGDPAANRCYNYGVGDFSHAVAMGWGFFRGSDSFWVAKQTPRELLAVYRHADRTIWTQPLPLTPAQKQNVIAKLDDDILEDHKYYAYDHFADNCTTRVRDVLDHATDGALSQMTETTDGRTFRDLARDGFYGMRIPLLITDMAMGRSTDRTPSYWERMFLPQYLREAVAKRWGITAIPIYQRKGPPQETDGPSGRVLFALLALGLTAPAWLTWRWGRFQRAGLAIAIGPPVLFGLVFWLLAIISPLPYVRWNESCLVFMPFDVLLLGVLSPARQRLYARGRVIMLALVALLDVIGVLHQPLLAPILWPLIPALVVGFLPVRAPAAAAVATPGAPAPPPSAAAKANARAKAGSKAKRRKR